MLLRRELVPLKLLLLFIIMTNRVSQCKSIVVAMGVHVHVGNNFRITTLILHVNISC